MTSGSRSSCTTHRGPLRGRGPAWRTLLNVWGMLRLIGFLTWNLPRAQRVLFLAAAPGLLQAGPIAYGLCRLFRRHLTVRPFGGDLDLVYLRASRRRRRLFARTVLRCDLLLLQTDHLCARFRRLVAGLSTEQAAEVRWFPTIREPGPEPDMTPGQPARFLFLAQLRPEKGYAEALAASDELTDGAFLDLYGPTMPGTNKALLTPRRNARWHGPLGSDEVAAVMLNHDVLVFPTYYEGEGMSGAVVEALQRGLAVITTHWRSMPEQVRDGQEGLLVAPRDSAALGSAMRQLSADPELLGSMRAAAPRPRAGSWARPNGPRASSIG